MHTARYLVLVAIFSALSEAQRFPDRFVTLNLLTDSTQAPGVQWMHATGGWGEFAAYRGVRDQEHAWLQRLGGYVEMMRMDDNASLAFVSNIEFIANPHNDIRFNPRAMIWEEGFLFTARSGRNFWQAGYFHRCKHDVDNLLTGTERSLIFGSLQGRYLVPFSTDDGSTKGLLAVRTDLYTIRQDDRTPAADSQDRLNLKRTIGSLGFSVHLRNRLPNSFLGLYLTVLGSTTAYSDREGIFSRFGAVTAATLNGGISAGIVVQGNAHFRIGFTYEYLSDTGIASPSQARLLSFGIVILNPSAMW